MAAGSPGASRLRMSSKLVMCSSCWRGALVREGCPSREELFRLPGWPRKQHAGLLEQFAERGNLEPGLACAVGGIDRPAGKDVHVAGERHRGRSVCQQDLEAVRTRPKE